MFRRQLRRLVPPVSTAFALCVLWIGQPAAQTTSLPSARQIIDKFLQATGGADTFKAIRSMHAKGVFSITGQQLGGELEMMAARPNKLLTRVRIEGIGPIEEGYDGKVGWSIDPIQGPALLKDRQLNERADEAWFDGPLHADDHVKSMTVIGRDEVLGRPAYRLKVVTTRGVEQFEFFDIENGLQVAVDASRDTPLGIVPTVTYLRDYQKFGPLLLPSKVVQRVLGQEQVFTFSSYEFDTVPPNTFDLPAPIKALIK
jgi:hypothetical protein